MRILVRLLIALAVVGTAVPTFSASFIVPTDRKLIEASKAIVIATAVSTYPIHTRDGVIDTVIQLRIDEVIKGDLRADVPLEIVEGGGFLDGRLEIVPEAPKYRVGERALIFLDTNKRGEYSTYGMVLGKFNFVRDLHGERLLVRGADDEEIFGWDAAGSRHVEKLRMEEGFLAFVRTTVCQATNDNDNYIAQDAQLAPSRKIRSAATSQAFHAADYQDIAFGSGGCETGCGIRWKDIFDFPSGSGSVAFQVLGSQTGIADALGGIDRAMAAWNNDPRSNVNYFRGGSALGVIHLDDSADVPAGAVGYTRYGGGATYTYDGGLMAATSSVDVAIKASFTNSQTLFDEVMTHELGHSLSFRHSADRAPSTSQAVMNFQSFGNFGASLQSWDMDAVQTVYGSGPVCTPPSITTQPSGVTITAGQSTTLSVGATGTSLTYQWYIGTRGTTTTQAPGGTGTQLTVSPGTTTNYWVRVTGQCAPTADSNTATVTVTCAPPSVPTPNASPSSISAGQSSTLSASPTGSGPFTYQWYVGNSGDTSNPIAGATNSSTSVSPTVTTNYWVRVTGQCGTIDSPHVPVNVACTPIAAGGVGAQPPTINLGQSSTISVTTSGSGPFTFQWYRGSVGDFSNPIATTSSTLVSPTTSTTYWVRVTAPCGSQDGSVTVFVNAPCTPSSITTNPAFATIAPGASATLTVVAAGTAPISYQWYTGTSGNTANPIAGATNASVTVSPAATTSYWVRVSNSCNPTGNNSTTAVVTVSANCPAATITTQPASVSAPIGTAATLKVVATVTGTTIHYQWYKGAKGDLSTKVGTDSDTFITGTVNVTASYWVRLTSACNPLTFTDSNAALVTATATPKGRAVRH